MPTRRAVLIAAPDTGSTPLEGARKDPKTIKDFLCSPYGGAWKESEIVELMNPNSTKVLSAVTAASSFDYVLIAFSGHGYHPAGSDNSDSRIELSDTYLSVSQLKPENQRHLLVIDSCRQLTVLTEERIMLGVEKSARLAPSPQRCRQLYDDTISASAADSAVLYACSVNELAGETSAGGIFTRALIRETENACRDSFSQNVVTVPKAFQVAAAKTTQVRKVQHPDYELGRNNTFPFGVVA